MTKDGRPSRIKDIRLFQGPHKSHVNDSAAVAYARRLAWWLNGEGFGIGHDPALYISFDPALAVGEIRLDPPRFTPDDWWYREAYVGVSSDFNGDDCLEAARTGTISVLKALVPEQSDLIDQAAQTVDEAGPEIRFLLKVKESASQILEVSTTIGTGRAATLLFMGLTSKESGIYRQAPPTSLGFYDDGVLLAGGVKLGRDTAALVPRTSSSARWLVEELAVDLSWHFDEFVEVPRPIISGLLAFR